MARQNVYMKKNTLDGIRKIVDQRLAEGATTADANMSSVASELLEIGLRVVENIEKKKEGDDEMTSDREQEYKKEMLLLCKQSSIASQMVMKMMFDMQEIKSDGRYNFNELREKMILDTESLSAKYFDGAGE
ncbi:MAG: relaxosome protein TraM [Hafnia sp.]|uniref:relaxosome protein TraM n=1 Tax=Hafnia sp. TaxID=1873498 RepID=UPI002FCB3073